ncbi:AMP-binding protein [Anaerosinus massiliensis]|uniref:AMP-binding protein n=1 Tax=Massilibacillus massiliensis TaxID=1806837 RepID=UPI000A75B5FC|nr:AMP-binding protein [Massilibacillus massiliensis]
MHYFTLLETMARKHKDKLFLCVNQQNYSYEMIYSAARRLGENIAARHAVILIYSDCLLFQLVAFFAVLKSGNVPIISHYDLPQTALKKLVLKNQIRYILSDQGLALDFIVDTQNVQDAFLSTTSIDKEMQVAPEICIGVLSSGSTDVPKVLFRTYESWADFFPVQNRIFQLNAATVLFLHGSFSFTGNLNAVLSVLYEGGLVLVTNVFQCKTWLKTIQEYQVTAIYLVPAKLRTFQKCIHEPIKSVTMIFTGSQLLFSKVAKSLKEIFVHANIILYYGASELNYITYIEYEALLNNPLSVGKPFPGVTVSIQDGCIYVDTPYHIWGIEMPYTVEDKGYFSEDQQLIFLGRQTQMINKGGFKISCVKVEEEIKKIPGIHNVAVIAYDDAKKGSEMAAFVVSDADLDKDYIRSEIKANLMKLEIPKKFIFLDAIPLNDSGKFDLQKLKSFVEK